MTFTETHSHTSISNICRRLLESLWQTSSCSANGQCPYTVQLRNETWHD